MTAAAIANDKLDVTAAAAPRKLAAARVAAAPAAAPAPKQPRVPLARRLEPFLKAVIPPVLGVVLLIGIWHLATLKSTSLPGPGKVWVEAVRLFSDPFYQNGPNDQGIGWNVLSSLRRVAIGFGFAALVGIPLGFLIGRFVFLNRMVEPIISLLRPVSPLAWLPIGLLVPSGRSSPASSSPRCCPT